MSGGKIWKLDRSGHGLVKEWSGDDAAAVKAGEVAFKELQDQGFALAKMPADGSNDGEIVKAFDPEAEVVAIPQLVGG